MTTTSHNIPPLLLYAKSAEYRRYGVITGTPFNRTIKYSDCKKIQGCLLYRPPEILFAFLICLSLDQEY